MDGGVVTDLVDLKRQNSTSASGKGKKQSAVHCRTPGSSGNQWHQILLEGVQMRLTTGRFVKRMFKNQLILLFKSLLPLFFHHLDGNLVLSSQER